MQEKINILNELKEADAAFLTEIDNRNLFTVPDDYFDNLHSDILSQVFIQSLPSINPYTVPESYFNYFPEIMLDNLSYFSFKTDNKDSFSVPEGYFDGLANNILKRIKAPVFESVQQELSQLSPFLSDIPKVNTYSVPPNYFDALNTSGVTGNNIAQEAKVLSISSKRRKWFSYAAAACIAAAISTGGYLYFNSKPAGNNISHLANVDVQKQLSVLSDDEINNYLKDNSNIAVYTNIGDDDQQQQGLNVQDLLQNVSDEEIHQYLNEDPESAEAGGGI
jgi:hypothetical protein